MIEHNLVRATNIPQIVKILCHYYNISEDEALKRFYESATGAITLMMKPVCMVKVLCISQDFSSLNKTETSTTHACNDP